MPLTPDDVSDDVLEQTVENLEDLSKEEQEALLQSEKISSRVEQQQELKERRDQLHDDILNTLADDEGWLFNPNAKETEMDALLNTGRYVDQEQFDEDAEDVTAETEQGRTFPLAEAGRVDTSSSYSTTEEDAFIDELMDRGELLSAAEIGSRLGASTRKVKEAVQGAIDQYKEEGKTFEAIKAAEAGKRIESRMQNDEDADDLELDSGYSKRDVAKELAADAEGKWVDPGVDADEDEYLAERIKEKTGPELVEDAGGASSASSLERTVKRAKESDNYREAIALSSKYKQALDLEFAGQDEEADYDEAEAEYRPDQLVKEAADTYWQTIQNASDETEKEEAYRNLAEINGMLDDNTVEQLDEDTQSKLLIASEYVDNKLATEDSYQDDTAEETMAETDEPEDTGYQDDTAAEAADSYQDDTTGMEEQEDDSGGFFSSLLG